jgi:3-hydroxybutyryl-CoA dehydratase
VTDVRTMSAHFSIDSETVLMWADLSGDHNRLHVDQAFAAGTSYGRCIAHGPILASMVGELLAQQVGDPWVMSSHVEFRFVAPVFVPSTVTAEVEITDGPTGTARVLCTDQDGTSVLTAEAHWQGPVR